MSILYIALLISFATLGFRAITGKGMIFYFLRKPFDNKSKRLADWDKLNKELVALELKIDIQSRNEFKLADYDKDEKRLKRTRIVLQHLELDINFNWDKFVLYIMKPIILCSTCMASVHTLIWWALMDFSWDYRVILVMLIVAFFNTVLWSIVEAMQGADEAFKKYYK